MDTKPESAQMAEVAEQALKGDGQIRTDILKVCDRLEQVEERFNAPIVCICGSTRFKQACIAENARLTQDGNIVLAVGLWGHHERKKPTPEQKQRLDELHKRKIDLCDWVWVLDVGCYIGDSTRSEIKYAESLKKPVRYLSKEFPNYIEPIEQAEEKIKQQQECIDSLIYFLKVIEHTEGATVQNLEATARRAIAEAEEILR